VIDIEKISNIEVGLQPDAQQCRNISDVDNTSAHAPIIYEDISDPEDTSPLMGTNCWLNDLESGQSAMYLVLNLRYIPKIVTLDSWDKQPTSLSLYSTYVAGLDQLYGQEVDEQFGQVDSVTFVCMQVALSSMAV